MSLLQNEVIFSDFFIYNIIESSSTPSILYNLKLTNKWHYKFINLSHIKLMVINNITNKLKELVNINYENLIKYMEKYNLSISGSFVLQCILNEYWTNSDIDFYTNYKDIDISIILNNKYNETVYNHNDEYPNFLGIENIKNFYTQNKERYLQLIFLDENKNIFDFVKDNFDFSICKNIYNITNGKHNLYITNIYDIFNKQLNCDLIGTSKKLQQRKEKYEMRGFKFNNIIGNYIYHAQEIIPIIMYNDNLKCLEIFNEIIYCDISKTIKIKLTNNIRIKILIDPNYPGNCPIEILDNSIKHCHPVFWIFIKRKKIKGYHKCIMITYSDNDMLKLYKNLYNGGTIDEKYNRLFISFDEYCKRINLIYNYV